MGGAFLVAQYSRRGPLWDLGGRKKRGKSDAVFPPLWRFLSSFSSHNTKKRNVEGGGGGGQISYGAKQIEQQKWGFISGIFLRKT